MNPFVTFLKEIRRLLRERVTLLFIAITAAGVVWFCLNSLGRTDMDAFILIAAKNSALLGSLLFGILTLIQFHRDYKNNTDSIVLTCTDPVFHQIRRTLALICMAVITTLILTLFTLPYALIKTGKYFQADTFAASWYLIFLGALVLSILLSSGLYMLFKQVSVAFVTIAVLIILSKLLEYQYDMNPSYLFFWVQTYARDFSDLVSNQFQIDMILWNRLFCMLAALSVWFLGLCSLRQYGRGVFGSFLSNARRAWIPVLLVMAVVFSGISYTTEPIFDNSIPEDFELDYDSGTGLTMALSNEDDDENKDLLLLDQQVKVDVDADSRTVSGNAVYTFQNLIGKPQTLSVDVNTGYVIKDVLVNGQPVEAFRDDIEVDNCATWYIHLPASTETVLELSYGGSPKNDCLYGQIVLSGICSEYIYLRLLGLYPCVNTKVSKNCRRSGTLTLDENLMPASEFKRLNTVDGKTQWSFSNPSRLMAAEYNTRTFEAGGLAVKFKYFAKHDDVIADMDAINVMKAAIDYFTKVYGPLPYKDYLVMLELPAIWNGGKAWGNISAFDETTFAEAGYSLTESDNPHRGGIKTIVHEIAHQWWGLATYPMMDETSHWSAEGITCYSTYRFMDDYFGAEYAKQHFVRVWQNNWKTYKNAFYIQNPKYLQKLSGKDSYNVLSTLENIGLYDIMPLELLKAEKAVGGPETFQEMLAQLYQSYLGKTITYEDFLSVTGLKKEVLNLE